MTKTSTPLVTDEQAFGDEGPFCLTDGIDLRKVEVIRNIHENPELLPTNTTEG